MTRFDSKSSFGVFETCAKPSEIWRQRQYLMTVLCQCMRRNSAAGLRIIFSKTSPYKAAFFFATFAIFYFSILRRKLHIHWSNSFRWLFSVHWKTSKLIWINRYGFFKKDIFILIFGPLSKSWGAHFSFDIWDIFQIFHLFQQRLLWIRQLCDMYSFANL